MPQQTTARLALSSATFAIDKPFDYLVPEALEGRIMPGMRVMVPFGRGNKAVEGFVLALNGEAEPTRGLKAILTVLDDEPVLTEPELKLCVWMSRRYFCTVYQCAKAMLPTGLWFSIQDVCRLVDGVDRESAYAAAGKSKNALRLVELLLAHPNGMELRELRLAFGTVNPSGAVKTLIQAGVAQVTASAKRSVSDKTEQICSLAVSPEEALDQVSRRRKTAPLQYNVIELLCAVGQRVPRIYLP